ncbi:MAG: polymer-forming cytoskeletal protein [Desulfobacterales bacterium]|nr:polymer-forming cytoskeletal protein [Desulfobacterales bacterium]
MADKSKGLSIIDKDLKVEGTIHAKGRLIIAGELEGTLVGDTVITVEGSRVLGEARVQHMVIAGEFEGDITSYGSLKILHTANFSGNIVCKILTLEAGGRLNGNVRPLESKDEILAAEAESPAAEGKTSSPEVEGDAGGADLPRPV